MRSLSRLRYQLTITQRRTKNRIKSFLDFQGIKTPDKGEIWHWTGAFLAWLESLEFKSMYDRQCLDFQIEGLRYHREKLTEVLRLIRDFGKQNQIIKNIQSVHGLVLLQPLLYMLS